MFENLSKYFRNLKVINLSKTVYFQVCDLPIDHPSCSKQHAAFQYRLVSRKKDDGSDVNR